MDPNVEENIDPSNSVMQRIIINNFEIKSNNFISKETVKPESNDVTMMAIMENYNGEDEKYLSNKSSTDFTKMIEEDNYKNYKDDIVKDSNCFIYCKLCNNILAIEGSIYSKLK